jgi:hypothetical protein
MRLFSVLLVFFSYYYIVPAFASNWEQKLDKEGIQVYTSKINGSSMDAFRGTMVVESSLSAIVALLQDYGRYPEWMFQTKEVKMLKREGNQVYVYFVSKAPWPVKSRDNVNVSIFEQNPETKEILISIKAVPDYMPPVAEYIRIPKAAGYWRLTPQGKGKVQLTYQMHSETGGSLPAWMSNLVVTQAPFQMLSNLREEIKKPRYRNAKIEYINEF